MRWTWSAMRLFNVVAVVLLTASVTAPAGVAVGLAGGVQTDGGASEYEVRPEDTLWGVASSQLGDPYRWPEIAAASAIVQPWWSVAHRPRSHSTWVDPRPARRRRTECPGPGQGFAPQDADTGLIELKTDLGPASRPQWKKVVSRPACGPAWSTALGPE
jgi:hypothetical protein